MFQTILKSLIFIIGLIGFPVLEIVVQEKATLDQANTAMPDARARAHFIYHPASKALLLFDGYAIHLDSTQNDVWKWAQIKAFGPGSRSGNAAALHTKTGQIYLFGGWGENFLKDNKDDTWIFNGSTWEKVNTGPIDAHDHHKMVFADHLGAFVIYSGRNAISGQPDSLTWLLKENVFTPLSIPGPGPRGNVGFAYDPGRKKLVLFGGKRYDQPADLWEFDGKIWKQIEVPDIGVTTGHAMTYSEELHMIIIHGTNGETWNWNGKSLSKIASGGPLGSGLALGYDPARKVIAAYGGFGEHNTIKSALWELKGGEWKKISDNGTWIQTSLNSYERMGDAEAEAFNQANTLLAEKKITQAETVLLKVLKTGIKSRALYAQLGQVQYQLGKYEAGVHAYEKLVEIKPIGHDFYDLARGYARINETDKAFIALYKAIENGYGSKEHFQKENDLASLRTDNRFKGLLEKVK
ncbi:hypothetical protein GXP67_04560 [Rhodocytophaga rosea]|uniref:Uncharacterized protein n=1 Tax=Rhodocytophaga rosea TaxID=2704465 RepID=A0A6C0GE08_9BACT|nr:hypothetical protein [Rhodocytophaga rosea]QHT65992.1 hypothetical protein GXP67_04560 [Rhodocytophaga rosea]